MERRHNANYGRGVHTIEQEAWCADPAALVTQLRATLSSPAYKPPLLPAIAMQLVSLTNRPDVTTQQLRQLLEQDPVLTAQVLRVAQSAAYSRGSLGSLDDAIARLGLRTLTELFLETALSMKVFRAKGFEGPMESLRKHSVLTAHAARAVCRTTSLPDEYAFLCGLLHDVGMAAMLILLGAGQRRDQAVPQFTELAPFLLSLHAEASHILAKAWELPPDVCLVLQCHHAFRIGARVHPLAAAVCVADWLAAQCGAAFDNEVSEAAAQEAATSLGLAPQQLSRLQRQLEEAASRR